MPDPEPRTTIWTKTSRDDLISAITIVRTQCRSQKQHSQIELLTGRHRKIAGILGPLVRTLTLKAGTNGQQVLKQVAFVKRIQDNPKTDFSEAPLDGLSKTWRAHVLDERGRVRKPPAAGGKQGYMAWVATRLREALRRHDVYVARSIKWADINGNLIPEDDTWRLGQKPEFCTAFDLPTDAAGLLIRFESELKEAYAEAQQALDQNGARARFVDNELIITPLEAEPEPESRQQLRNHIDQMPQVPWGCPPSTWPRC